MRVSVCGIGIISPFGNTPEDFWRYLNSQPHFIDTQKLDDAHTQSMRVSSYDPSTIFDEKQLHNLDVNSTFISGAAKHAIADSRIDLKLIDVQRVGVIIGVSISIATPMSEFDESVRLEGVRRSRIGIFPNTVMCAPASRVSIFEKIKGINTTVSSGFNSGIDAIGLARNWLYDGDGVDIMLAGASEAISERILQGLSSEGMLLSEGDEITSERGRLIPSEGACAFILSRADIGGRSPTYCHIDAYLSTFCSSKKRAIIARAFSISENVEKTISAAGLTPSDISCAMISGYFDSNVNTVEEQALKRVFKEKLKKMPVLMPKKVLGESFAVNGAWSIAAICGIFNRKIDTPAVTHILSSYGSPTFSIDNVKRVLMIHTDPNGHNASMILSK